MENLAHWKQSMLHMKLAARTAKEFNDNMDDMETREGEWNMRIECLKAVLGERLSYEKDWSLLEKLEPAAMLEGEIAGQDQMEILTRETSNMSL